MALCPLASGKGGCIVELVVSQRCPLSFDHGAGNLELGSVSENFVKGNM